MPDGAAQSGTHPLPPTPLQIAGGFLQSAPVDLAGMADHLGLFVEEKNDMGTDLSGIITPCQQSPAGYKILLNGQHSYERKRFTLAHEIAHYLLHRDRIGDGITDNSLYRSNLGDEVELQANNLAANLLLPSSLVRSIYHAGLRSLSGLSHAFEVSEDAMRVRLRQLKLGV